MAISRPIHLLLALLASGAVSAAESAVAGAAVDAATGSAASSDATVDPGAASAATAAATAADEGTLETVTVSAQRRTQLAQDVPIPVQVVTPQLIRSLEATDLAQMSGYVPGLQVSGEQPTQPGYTLRGISVSDFGIGTDSPIGIYEDGVYTGKTGGALLLFNDVQRIEVLKGPQGTLFGRNSAAGAISVVSNEPGNFWSAAATARFGDYGAQYYDAMVNAPLGDDLAARVSFVDRHSDGWLRDSATGERYDRDGDWGLRAQLRWNAPADTHVRLIWEHEELAQPARPAIGVVALPPAPGLPPPFIPGVSSTADWVDPLHAPVLNDVVNGRESRSFDGLTLRITHSFDFADLTSITGYRHFNTYNREDQDGTNRSYLYFDDANIEQNTSWSQEFTLAHSNSSADWVAGADYYYDDANQTSQLNFLTDSIDTVLNNTGLAPGGLYGPISQATGVNLLGLPWQENMFNHGIYRAAAVFGDVIWHIAPRWNLTTGVRFTHDEKDFSWYNPTRSAPQLDAALAQLYPGGVPVVPVLPPLQTFQQNLVFNTPVSTAAPLRLNNSWNDTSPRVVLDYKPANDLMVYGSATKGYQAGGYKALAPGATYQPETVRNYELGIKSELADHRLLLNASVYYYLYSNLQNLSLITNGSVIPQYQVTVSDVHAKGLETEARWQATEGLRLYVVAAYIDSTYKDYVAPDGTDLAGQATGVPLWSAAGGLEYLWRNLAAGDLDLTLQHAYLGAERCNADSQAQGSCLAIAAFSTGTATNRTDARLGWTSHATVPVTLAVYANNLFDNRYVTGVQTISATTLGTPFANITAPRFYGVEVGAHF
jgi:iron complex outermembrane recepter protein